MLAWRLRRVPLPAYCDPIRSSRLFLVITIKLLSVACQLVFVTSFFGRQHTAFLLDTPKAVVVPLKQKIGSP